MTPSETNNSRPYHHRRQSIGLHGVRTPPIFEGKGRGKEKSKGIEKGKKKEERGTPPDFYLD